MDTIPNLKTWREWLNAKLRTASCACSHISEKGEFRIKAGVISEVFRISHKLDLNIWAELTSVHRRIRGQQEHFEQRQ